MMSLACLLFEENFLILSSCTFDLNHYEEAWLWNFVIVGLSVSLSVHGVHVHLDQAM